MVKNYVDVLPMSREKKTKLKMVKKIISVFTNIEEYQLLQIGKDLVVEGTHIEQVIEVLVGALD